MKRSIGLLGLMFWSASAISQTTPIPQRQKPMSDEYQQLIGILSASEAEIGRSNPDIRGYLCVQSANVYKGNRQARTKKLQECMTLSFSLEDTGIRTYVQLQALDGIFSADRDLLQGYIEQTEAPVKKLYYSRSVQEAVSRRRHEQAIELLEKCSALTDFPYRAAVSVLMSLPKENRSEKLRVFSAALRSYQLEPPQTDPRAEDLATLVIRFWKDLPPSIVIDAINELFEHAKQDLKNQVQTSLTISTGSGIAEFKSGLQYRYFQLVPILKKLDSSLPDVILRDNPKLAAALGEYPNGLQSLEPTYRDTPLEPTETPRFAITYQLHNANPIVLSLADRSRRNAEGLVSLAKSDPSAALAGIMALADPETTRSYKSIRADALVRLAQENFVVRPLITTQAIDSLKKLALELPDISKAYYLLKMADVYIKNGELGNGGELLGEAHSQIGKIYEVDVSPTRPNKAFKMEWPSTTLYRHTLILMSKVSVSRAQSFLSTIQDREIRAAAGISLVGYQFRQIMPASLLRQKFDENPGSVLTLEF
ncbi:MAG TPA: hypothetical protein VMZ25_06695 [Terriglobales bacterium]|nr:hypothetical protein [Terriglobales bacterium]